MKKYRLLFAFCLLSTISNAQKIIHVTATGAGAMDGKYWSSAYSDLAKALSEATYGDQVWVSEGIYTLGPQADRSSSFILKNGVRVFGGFSPQDTAFQQRDWVRHPTVLSGELGAAGVLDNARHVVFGMGLDSTTVLDGLSITAGYAIDESLADQLDIEGGGLLLLGAPGIANSKPLLKNCRVYGNAACYGGGACFTWRDPQRPEWGKHPISPRLVNCVFEHNQALYEGGGIVKRGLIADGDTFAMRACTISDNRAKLSSAGGVFLGETGNTNLLIADCLFERDSAIDGATMFLINDPVGGNTTDVAIVRTTFKANYSFDGYGFYYSSLRVFPRADSVALHLLMEDCLFQGNWTRSNRGPVFMDKGKYGTNAIQIRRCKFLDNKVFVSNDFLRINIGPNEEANIGFADCLFANNGVGTAPTVTVSLGQYVKAQIYYNNCVFLGNSGGIATVAFEEIYAQTTVTNCTFYNNNQYIFTNSFYPSFFNTAYFNRTTILNCIIEEPRSTVSRMFYDNDPNHFSGLDFFKLRNCFVSLPGPPPSTAEWQATNYFGRDPMFWDPDNGDLRLNPCSPAVGAGDNQYVAKAGLTTDLEGNPRILFKNVDLGAYEQTDSCGVSSAGEPVFGPHQHLWMAPNPSPDGLVQIGGYAATDPVCRMRVFDLYGRLQYNKALNLGISNTVDLSFLPEGTYWIHLMGEHETYPLKWQRL